MSELSVPWPGVTTTDAGPYNSSTWNDVWLAMSRSGGRLSRVADYDIGVFYGIANALVPASNVTEITVNTGASLIDGLYHENTASVAVPIPASGAGTSRIDVVVVRKNYQQAVTYTPTGGAPTVPPRTARITVIRGVEAAGPAAPALTQDVTRTTYWDIPLAQVQVSDAGALSGFTDLREFVDAETKYLIVNPSRSYNSTDGTTPLTWDGAGLNLINGKLTRVNAEFFTPSDFISDLVVSAIVRPAASGNLYGETFWTYAADTVAFNDTTGGTGFVATAVTGAAVNHNNNIILSSDVSGVAASDIITFEFNRDAVDVLDTVNADAYFAGFYVTYFGWKK